MATPLEAVAVVVPLSLEPELAAVIVTVIEFSLVTGSPNGSTKETCGATVNDAPELIPDAGLERVINFPVGVSTSMPLEAAM